MKLWMLIAVVAIASACSKQDLEPASENENTTTVEFVADEVAGRTVFGEPDGTTYPTLWEEDDNVSVWVNSQTRKKVTVTPLDEGKRASIKAALTDDGTGSYTVHMVYPGDAYVWGSANGKNAHIVIQAVQESTASSCDPSAQILAANTDTLEGSSLEEAFAGNGTLQFRHLTAYGCLALKNLPAAETIKTVVVTADEFLVGRLVYAFEGTTSTFTYHSNAENHSKSISISIADPSKVWFALYPCDLSGKQLTIRAVREDECYYEKTITFTQGGNFQAGRIAKFGVDFSGVALSEAETDSKYVPYKENGQVVGIRYWVSDDGKTAKVISLQRTEATPWCVVKETGAVPSPIPHTQATDSSADRMINWTTLTSWVEVNSDYSLPIYDFCKSLGEGWIWTCEQDLRDIRKIYAADAEALDQALTSNGGVALNANSSDDGDTTGDRYWSSREYTSTSAGNASKVGVNAHWVRMDTGTESRNNANKKNKYFGRAIKEISLE